MADRRALEEATISSNQHHGTGRSSHTYSNRIPRSPFLPRAILPAGGSTSPLKKKTKQQQQLQAAKNNNWCDLTGQNGAQVRFPHTPPSEKEEKTVARSHRGLDDDDDDDDDCVVKTRGKQVDHLTVLWGYSEQVDYLCIINI